MIDDCLMAEKAVEHLIDTGRRNIVHLVGPVNLEVSASRSQGFANTLSRHGIDPEGRCLPAGIFIKDGYDAARRLLDAGAPLPDAIFCFNDPVAIGAMKALKNAGIRIPQDIAIVGFSEGSMATVVEPQLTTVQQPMHEMGRQAATLLLKQLHATRRQMPQTVCLDATLNIRDSSVAKIYGIPTSRIRLERISDAEVEGGVFPSEVVDPFRFAHAVGAVNLYAPVETQDHEFDVEAQTHACVESQLFVEAVEAEYSVVGHLRFVHAEIPHVAQIEEGRAVEHAPDGESEFEIGLQTHVAHLHG